MDNAARFRVESGRTRADLTGCVACLVDAFACIIFLVLPATPANAGLLCIVLLVDQITCIVGYCVMYRRLLVAKPKLAELGFYLLISGTLFLAGQGSRGSLEAQRVNCSGFDSAFLFRCPAINYGGLPVQESQS